MGKKKNKLPPFVAVTWKMLNSAAFKELSPSASKILIYFIGKPKIIITSYEFYTTSFNFTYREAQTLGFSPSTYFRCIEELVSKGFIDPVWKGGLRGDGKSANKFKNSQRWLDYGKPTFIKKSWQQFVQGDAF